MKIFSSFFSRRSGRADEAALAVDDDDDDDGDDDADVCLESDALHFCLGLADPPQPYPPFRGFVLGLGLGCEREFG